MLRSYLAAWLRHFSRNRVYCVVSVLGLAVGLTAALLAALYVRGESTHDQFIVGYERTYLVVNAGGPIDRDYSYDVRTNVRLARLLTLQFKEVEAVARLARQTVKLRSSSNEIEEVSYSADPGVFDVLPMPVVAGDLKTALRSPDGIVLPRSIARKYFGRDAPIGERLTVDGSRTVTVTAVVEDLPANGTELETAIFLSGLAARSELARLDAEYGNAQNAPFFGVNVRTYLRLKPGASIETLRPMIPEVVKAQWPAIPPMAKLSLELVPLDQVHLFAPLNPGLRGRLMLAAIIGALILLVACINFVNLLAAQSVQRAKEVGVRKMAGASRAALLSQFLGESLAYVVVATLIGIALLELLLPYASAFLDTGIRFDVLRDPGLVAWIAGGAVLLTIAVGAYPALVLASFPPAAALNGVNARWSGAGLVRQVLVTIQFAILIGLIIAAGVVQQQRRFATRDALRMSTDQVLIVRSPCNPAFIAGLKALPGVKSAACSGAQLLDSQFEAHFIRPDRSLLTFNVVPTELTMFDVYGLRPISGALPAQVSVLPRSPAGYVGGAPFVLNETAARLMAFATPDAAVGRTISTQSFGGPVESNQILAVVPDFTMGSVEEKIRPTAYLVDPTLFRLISVKLGAGDVFPTLESIDRLWQATAAGKPIVRFFLNDHIESLYLSLLREAQAFGFFSGIAIFLACLGLLALSASLAEQRTREFGIRKAMGAETRDIARLLLWQFARPVILATLIAWPAAAWAMNRWLQGFAYHADLDPWLFATATGVALIAALSTVSGQSLRVARGSAVSALRYQ